MRKEFMIGVIVSILMVFFVCSAVPAGTIELWTDEASMDRGVERSWNWIYSEYERKTGEKVKVVYVPYDELEKKLMAGFAAGTAPDIMAIDRSWLPSFLKNELVEPFPSDLQKKWESIALPVFKKFKIKGKVYTLPYGIDLYGLNYNKNMFREVGLDPNDPPETWKEFRAYAKKLTKYGTDGKVTRMGFGIRYLGHPGGVVHKHLWAIWSAGASLVEPPDVLRGGKAGFNNEAGFAAVDLMVKMLYEDRSTAFGFPDPRQAFVEKLGAMFICCPRCTTWRYFKEAPDMDYGIAPNPRAERGEHVTNLNAHPTLCVTSTSDKKVLAFKFIEYLMRPEIQLYIPLTTNIDKLGFGYPPFSKSIWTHGWFASNPYYIKTLELTKYARIYPVNVHLAEVFEIFGSYMVKAWHKEISVKEALAKAEKEVNAVLAEE